MDRHKFKLTMLILVLLSIICFPSIVNANVSSTSGSRSNGPLRIMTPAPHLLDKLSAQNGLQKIKEIYNNVAARNSRDQAKALPPGGAAAMRGAAAAPSKASAPVTPAAKALAIAVQYPDESATTDISYFQNILFGDNFGTMRDYYRTVSNGQFLVTGQVVGASQDTVFITLPHNKNYYAQNSYGEDGAYPNNSQGLVADAVQALITANFDWTPYKNSSGEVPYLFVIHAGPGAESTADTTDMWSCRWALNENAIVTGNTTINDFTLEPELTAASSNTFVPSTMGVYAHEFGHNLGLPDLYDVNYTSQGDGLWSIMAAGSWGGPNGMGDVPSEFDCWSKIFLGWTTPEVVPAGTSTKNIQQIEGASGNVLQLNTPESNEYYLVENRQKTSYDQYLPGNGLLIWHIDKSIANPNSDYWKYYNTVNSTPSVKSTTPCPPHHGVYVVEADAEGGLDLYSNHNPGDTGDPFPGSSNVRAVIGSGVKPNLSTWDGLDSGLALDSVSDSSSTMSANVTVVGLAPPTQHELSGTVTDPSGNPIEAGVYIFSKDSTNYSTSTTTDASGVFSFDNIPAGNYYVYANSYYGSPYFNSIPMTVTLDPSSTLNLTLQLTTAEIQGQVHNPDGSVALNSYVVLYNNEWYTSSYVDDQGNYQLGGIPGGDAMLVARPGSLSYAPKNPAKGSLQRIDDQAAFQKAIAEGQKTPALTTGNNVFSSVPVKVTIVEGQTITQDVTLTPAEVTGTVKDPQNNPVNATVVILNRVNNTQVESDDTGAYALGGLPAGDYIIYAYPNSASAYFNSVPQDITLDPNNPKTLDLVLSTAEIGGGVKNPDQTPASGQDVVLYDDFYQITTTSDANGNYQLGGLPTGYYYVQAIPASASGSVESLLGSTGGQKGHVQPVKDKDALAKALQEAAQVAAAAGNVYPSFPIRVHIVEGQLAAQDVQLAGDELTGSVTDPNGTGLPGRIYLYSAENQVSKYIDTNPDGSFATGGFSAGDYTIIAYDESANNYFNSIPQVVTIDPANVKNLNLKLTTKEIQGQVLGPDGLPGGSTWVVIYNDDYYLQEPTDAQGNYEGGGLPTGDYHIFANTNFFYPPTAGASNKPMVRPIEDKEAFAKAVAAAQGGFASVPIQVTITEQQVLTQGLQLTAAEVTGQVQDPTGQPITASVEIFNNVTGACQINTDDNGNYSLGGLSSGSYTLIAYAQDANSPYFNSIPQTVVVEQGQAKTINLQLTTAELQGTVQTSDGSPSSNITVIAYGEDYLNYLKVTTDNQGHYTLGGLAGGNYYVVATNQFNYGSPTKVPTPILDKAKFMQALQAASEQQDYQSLPVEVSIVEGSLTSQDLQLSGKEIEGTVYKPDKTTTSNGAQVILHDPNYSVYAWAQCDLNGHYELGGIPAGDYYVYAYPGYADFSSALKSVSVDRAEGSLQHVVDPEALKKALSVFQTDIFQSAQIKVHIDAGELVTQDIYLTGPSFKGTVTDPNGVPIKARVEIIDADGNYVNDTTTNEGGEYLLGGVSGGNVTIVAYPYYLSDYKIYFNSIPTSQTVTDSVQTVDLQLTTKEIQGVVSKPAPDPEGAAASGMMVVVYDTNNSWFAETTSGSDGSYALGGLPTNDYYIQALPYYHSDSGQFAPSNQIQATGGLHFVTDKDAFKNALSAAQSASSDQGCASFPQKVHITAGQLLTMNIILSPPQVSGTVTMPNAPTGQEYSVTLVAVGESHPTSSTVTKNGFYQFGGVNNGKYLVIAYSPDLTKYANGIAQVNITGTNNLSQNITLPAPAFQGTVTTPNGSITPAYVYLSYYNTAIQANNGFYAFGTVPDGQYQLRAYSNESSRLTPSYTQTVKVTTGTPDKTEYDLSLTVPVLKGTVLDPDGETVSNVQVKLQDGNGSNYTRTSYDGTFQFGGVPDGTYTLSVQVPTGKSWTVPQSASVDLQAGQLVTQTLQFIKGVDTTAPTVDSSCPTTGATDVDVNSSITVEFSEDIQSSTAYNNISLKNSAGATASISTNIQGSTLTVSPTAPLAFNKQYTLTVPLNSVKDMTGNNLKVAYSVTFTTVKAQMVDIKADPASVSVLVGASQTVNISAVYEDGSTVDVSKNAQFASGDTGIASVTGNVVRGVAKGETELTASYQDYQIQIPVKVTATVKSIVAAPTSLNLITGDTHDITLTATYSDNSTEDVTSYADWSSNKTSVATVDNGGTVTAVAKGTATITAGFSGKTATVTVSVTPPIQGIQALPDDVTLLAGKVQAVKVNLLYGDGSTQDVTSKIQWTSNDSSVATMTTSGIRAGTSRGETTIDGYYNDDLSVHVHVKVILPVKSLTADPAALNLIIDGTQAIAVNAVYTDNSTEDVSSSVSWKSSSPSVATVDDQGMVTAAAKGTSTITATLGGKSVSIPVKVTPPIDSIQVDQDNVYLMVGKFQAVKVNLAYTDGSSEDVTKNINWTSDNEDAAIMTTTGVRGVAVGEATLTGQYNEDFSVEVHVKVTLAAKSLTPDPAAVNLIVGENQAIALNAVYTDNTNEEVSSMATWKSAKTSIATVDNTGMVTAVAKGTTTITAAFGGKTATINIKVTPPVQDIQVDQENVSLIKGKFQAVKVNVVYNDNSKEDVTKSIQWTSDNEDVAIMTTTGIRGVDAGEATLTGKYNDDFSVEVHVKVTLPVKSLTPDPKAVNLITDENQAIALTAVYSDNSTEEVSGAATWKSAKTSIASVDDTGTVTAVAKGTTTITATFGGKTATINIKVTPPVQDIQVDQENVSLIKGKFQAVKVNVVYDDNSKEDVTKSIQWTSDNEDVAIMTATGIRGVDAGEATMTGKYNEDFSVQVHVKVTLPVKSLTPDPAAVNLIIGENQAIALNAVYSDNSPEEVSGAATWKSAKTSIATVDDTGTVTAVAKGTTTITATFGGKTATITVKVTPVVTGLQANMENVALLVNKFQAVKVNVQYEDGTTEDVTKNINWTSDNEDAAIMTTTGIKGVAAGEATLTGQYNEDFSVEVHVKVTLPAKTLTADPANANLIIGDNQAVTLTAVYANTAQEDVSSYATWKSAKTSIATVDNTGTITAVAKGTTTITAAFGGKTVTINVKVTTPIQEIQVDQENIAVAINKTQAVKVSLVYDDNSMEDVTRNIQWSSDDSSIATMTATGIKGVAVGETTLTGVYNENFSVTVNVKVTPALKSLTADQTSLSLAAGDTQVIALTAAYSDNTSEDVSNAALWKSSKTNIATVDSQGTVTAVAKGTASITATYEGKTITINVTVSDPGTAVAAALSSNLFVSSQPSTAKVSPDSGNLKVVAANTAIGNVTKK